MKSANSVVFDTTTVISALVFRSGRLVWLREHWRQQQCRPWISHKTVAELTRVLAYPKFRLSTGDREELLADYLPYCSVCKTVMPSSYRCRDSSNQPFLDLAETTKSSSLVSGDRDLLALAGTTKFLIETPEQYRRRVGTR